MSQISELVNSRRTDPARKNSKPGDSPLNYLYPGRPMSVYDSPSIAEIQTEPQMRCADKATRERSQSEADYFDRRVDEIAYEQGGGEFEGISPHPVVTPDNMVDVPDLAFVNLNSEPRAKQQQVRERENFTGDTRRITNPATGQLMDHGLPHQQSKTNPRLIEGFEATKDSSGQSSPSTFMYVSITVIVILLILLVVGLFVMMLTRHHEVPLSA